MAKSEDPASVLKSIRKDKSPHNIYLLYGDEPYFTDKIERKLVSTYMSPDAWTSTTHCSMAMRPMERMSPLR
ncbi:hypothetical protein [Porphyromonas cangingivalis]|uniref:hypothetical protein n=1 Tax=Porphyromonas cangingivalis TaxID=36874 RepID=UPI0011DC965C|nr:hypothetical protein [Porphyromonas cangingivalis]